MQLIATGKWSKHLKRWTMVVAIRRPAPKRDTPQPLTRGPKRGH